jgi:hypothetical protein
VEANFWRQISWGNVFGGKFINLEAKFWSQMFFEVNLFRSIFMFRGVYLYGWSLGGLDFSCFETVLDIDSVHAHQCTIFP